jgi:hypothetical protein
MRLYQKQGLPQFYVGWYGVCDESGGIDVTDPDAPCRTLDLVTSKYDGDASFVLQWSGGLGNFREQLVKVVQIRNDGTGTAFYNMVALRGLRTFYQGPPFNMDFTTASANADLAAVADPTNPTHQFTELVCGKAYTIVVQAGTTGSTLGATTGFIDLPEFKYYYVGSPDSGLRLSAECCGYGAG